MILLFDIFSFLKKKFLAALVESAEVTHHTALFKTDGLAAFRALFAHQAVFGFVIFWGIFSGHISFFQHAGDGIRNGQHQTAILGNWKLTADTLQLIDNFIHFDAGSQRQ